MRITTWNINGLRAALAKGVWSWVEKENPDVLCLQEIKARPEQISDDHHLLFNGQDVFWNPAEKPGYSGVAIFSRQPPQKVDLGIGVPMFDREGRVIRLKFPGFVLFNVYFPSGQRGQDRVDFKLDFYAHLLEILDQAHQSGEKIIICGDFNTAHKEIDLRHPKANKNTSGFLPQERAWIDTYLTHGFVDIFRMLYPEQVAYTWWTYLLKAREHNVGWRLDYFLISKALVSCVRDVIIHSDITGSDHCPVTLVIDA